MTILLLDQFADLAGGQRCLLDLVPGLQHAGWTVYAAVPEDGPLNPALRSHGVDPRALRCGPYSNGHKTLTDVFRFATGLPRLTGRLGSLLDELHPDLLYVNGPRLLPAASLATRGRLPVIFHCHTRLSQPFVARLARESLRRANAVTIACCAFAAEPLHAERLHVIYNGVPECARHTPGSGRRVGVIGRIVEQKGQAEFIEAARLLMRDGADWQFVICGAPLLGSSPAYLASLRTLARGLPVQFIGWQDDISSLLSCLDLLVVPSKGAEPAPRVILEAYSAGVPVVASRCGGIPEIVKHGQTGWLVDKPTPAALARAIDQVITCPGALAENAREAWERNYTVERYRADVLDVIERTASHR
jgi:glycosyltransferase involved in cell wall biosynthesis